MSRHSTHTTSIYSTYDQSSSNVQPSRNSTYTPVTNHYNQAHVAKSVSPADTNPDDVDLNHPANWGIFDDPSQPPRRPKWERKPSAATQSYPVTHYDPSRQTVPTASGTDGLLPQGSYSYAAHGTPFVAGNAFSVNTQSPNQNFPAPYVSSAHVYPSSTASTSIPPQGSSTHVSPSRAPAQASAEPRSLSPSEWYDPSSQAPGIDASSPEQRDKDRHRSRKPARQSKLDGIPRDRMQRFRVVDLGPGPSSSSGSKRTRSPGSEVLPDAKVRATVQDDTNGGSKGKGRAELSLEEEKLREKRKKEADRVQVYRNTVDGAYDELRAVLYPQEEKYPSVRSEHRKLQCMRDAAVRIRTSTPNDICRKKEAALYARIGELEALNASQRAASQGGSINAELHKCYQNIAYLRQQVSILLEEKDRQM